MVSQNICIYVYNSPVKQKKLNQKIEKLNKKPNKLETNKIFFLLIVKITKIIIIKFLYNMTEDDNIYYHIFIASLFILSGQELSLYTYLFPI